MVEERFEHGFGDAQGPLGGRGGGEGGGFLGEAGEGELLLCEVEVTGGDLGGGLVGEQWEGAGGATDVHAVGHDCVDVFLDCLHSGGHLGGWVRCERW